MENTKGAESAEMMPEMTPEILLEIGTGQSEQGLDLELETFQGFQGPRGEPGVTPHLSVGAVSEGETAQVTISGTAEEPVLSFVLPGLGRGEYPEYGVIAAHADGTTDDTVALTLALNRSRAVVNGGNRRYKLTTLTISWQKDLVIRNFTFVQGVSVILRSCERVTFENCRWEDFNDNGIANAFVQGCILTSVGSDVTAENGYREDEICRDIVFERCVFSGTRYCEHFAGTGRPHYTTGMAILLAGVDGVYVRHCTFTQNRGNACIQSNSRALLGDFEMTDNLFYLNGYGAIELFAYTAMSPRKPRRISGNRFIGCGVGYLPPAYLLEAQESRRGVGCAVLYGGYNGQSYDMDDADEDGMGGFLSVMVDGNIFEDNVESSIEGCGFNPVQGNFIYGQGALQTEESVQRIRAKYRIDYTLMTRKNPSQNTIYCYGAASARETDEPHVYQNNVMGRTEGTVNPILFTGEYPQTLIVKDNVMMNDGNEADGIYAHFLWPTLRKGLIWTGNAGFNPSFNRTSFGGTSHMDAMRDMLDCTFHSGARIEGAPSRFPELIASRYDEAVCRLRNEVSTADEDRCVTLGFRLLPQTQERPGGESYSIRNETDYGEETGCAFGGMDAPRIIDTGIAPAQADTGFTLFVDAKTLSMNGTTGSEYYPIHLFALGDGTLLNVGPRYGGNFLSAQVNGTFTNLCNRDAILGAGKRAKLLFRRAAGAEVIEVYGDRDDLLAAKQTLASAKLTDIPFTQTGSGTLCIGNAQGETEDKYAYHGEIYDFLCYPRALTDDEAGELLFGDDREGGDGTEGSLVYDIQNDARYDEEAGALAFDGTFAVDTGVNLFANADDFTLIAEFQFDRLTGDGGPGDGGPGDGRPERVPNFTYYPVLSQMDYATENGARPNGFDIGFSMQNGTAASGTARGGFLYFRNYWIYEQNALLDGRHYGDYDEQRYAFIVRRENGEISVYDGYLRKVGSLTGEMATATLSGNLTLGADMGYEAEGYERYFRGKITRLKAYARALPFRTLEAWYPTLYDTQVSLKGAAVYSIENRRYREQLVRHVQLEMTCDLGEYAGAAYAAQYPEAFAVFIEGQEEIYWFPAGGESAHIRQMLPVKWNTSVPPYGSLQAVVVNSGVIPELSLKVKAFRALLLTREVIPTEALDAVMFTLTFDGDALSMSVGEKIAGHASYYPEGATTGLQMTAASEDESIVTAEVIGDVLWLQAMSAGETTVTAYIPSGASEAYRVKVTG